MTRHDDTVRLRHMVEHAEEAVNLSEGRSREELSSNRTFELALTHFLSISSLSHFRYCKTATSENAKLPMLVSVKLKIIEC
jgi:hypothetical protein